MQNTDKKKHIVIYVSNTSLSIKQLVNKDFINELKKKYQVIILSTFKFPKIFKDKNKGLIFYEISESDFSKANKKTFYRVLIFFMQFLHNNSYKNNTLRDFNEIFLNEKLKYKNIFFSFFFRSFWKTLLILFSNFYYLRILLNLILRYLFNPKSLLISKIINKYKPKILITSSPGYLNYDLQVINLFKSFKVKTACFLLSWDHASGLGYIRSRMNLYMVWGQNSYNDLIKFSDVKESKIKITGPLHWKFHFDKKYEINKETFFKNNNFDINKKTILISLKSPTRTNINEIIDFLKKLSVFKFETDVQFILKPHPINFVKKFEIDLNFLKDFCDNNKNFFITKNFYSSNNLNNENISEKNGDVNSQINYLDEENSYNLNLLKHSDLMINFFSTLNIEAGIHGLASINYIYSDESEYRIVDNRKNLYIDYNQVHNYRLVKSKGTKVCYDFDSLLESINNILFTYNKKNKLDLNNMVYNEISSKTSESHILAAKSINEII